MTVENVIPDHAHLLISYGNIAATLRHFPCLRGINDHLHVVRQTKYCAYLLVIMFFLYVCSKEPSLLDGSFEYPQHMFWLIIRKIFLNTHSYLEACLDLFHLLCV